MCRKGDSNLSGVSPYTDPNIKVDSYPGATFHHITANLKKIPTYHTTTSVILQVGLNSCLSEHEPSTFLKQIQQMWSTSKTTFPSAAIYIPVINFSNRLGSWKKNITHQTLHHSLKVQFHPRNQSTTFSD